MIVYCHCGCGQIVPPRWYEYTTAKGRKKLSCKQFHWLPGHRACDKAYCPTRKEIEEACKRIQATWSKQMEKKRRVDGARKIYELPIINLTSEVAVKLNLGRGRT